VVMPGGSAAIDRRPTEANKKSTIYTYSLGERTVVFPQIINKSKLKLPAMCPQI
jgi:hypothetical protein